MEPEKTKFGIDFHAGGVKASSEHMAAQRNGALQNILSKALCLEHEMRPVYHLPI
jgi:hypothetical protein